MRLDDVWFRYGPRGAWILREVALTAEPGQVVVLGGRNGVGKSTLLQLAAGVLRPDRGAVRERPPITGWVPERFPADQPFTVRQYLDAMARLRGLRADAAAAAVDAWTERLGLTPYGHVKLPALSKGTAQKVGLAQALLRPPGLLILDEPWEGLDGPTRELVPDVAREVAGAGGIVLVSDHRGETARLPEAVGWTLADGRVSVAAPDRPGDMCVIEIEVPAAGAAGTVAALRAAGHHVLRVREPEPSPRPEFAHQQEAR